MNSVETLELIKTLKACGATHFKSNDFEISLDKSVSFEPATSQPWSPEIPAPIDPVAKEDTEKLKKMMSTLNMTPEQLANAMFPDGAI